MIECLRFSNVNRHFQTHLKNRIRLHSSPTYPATLPFHQLSCWHTHRSCCGPFYCAKPQSHVVSEGSTVVSSSPIVSLLESLQLVVHQHNDLACFLKPSVCWMNLANNLARLRIFCCVVHVDCALLWSRPSDSVTWSHQVFIYYTYFTAGLRGWDQYFKIRTLPGNPLVVPGRWHSYHAYTLHSKMADITKKRTNYSPTFPFCL